MTAATRIRVLPGHTIYLLWQGGYAFASVCLFVGLYVNRNTVKF